MFEAWTLRKDVVRAKEDKLREALGALSDEERQAYYWQYEKAVKDPDTYAVLNWFFLTGLHHFYLGKFVRGLANLLLMAAGVMALVEGYGWGLLLILGVILIEIPALFRSQLIVENDNIRRGVAILDGKTD